ncbi:cell division cycle, putative [Ricinus communis]|uniref:Cell division cycle, putative n=1 Tax=Ricinus communis TaxID=3988 RepID=B9RA26_RICCO|nr:cell division cycle, putative [Ricinus communis]|eukprot:XP_002511051.1 cell division cycle 20.3, cofactor of APC complex [Ricinus communis]
MEQNQKKIQQLQSDWYSPRRLHDSPTKYDFPGDRFIPNRSLMNLDQAHSLLTNRSKQVPDLIFNEVYQQLLMENLTLDTEGRPLKMLVFRGSPKLSRKWTHLIDQMRTDDAEALRNSPKQYQCLRRLTKRETRVLDAPNIIDDYYVNIIDWGKNNVIAVALGQAIYLWNAENKSTLKLLEVESDSDYPTSISWSEDNRSLAVGYMQSKLQLWDTEALRCVRQMDGHKNRVATLAWNGHTLTSGSRDKTILNRDVRVRNSTSRILAHTEEVCGLKWSTEGNLLASGGNENLIHIWEASKMSSSNFLHQFKGHRSAVKALAWCPYQFNVLASGGGTKDGCIKIWNVRKGSCIHSIHTNSQICALEWNRHHKEILSGHGYSLGPLQNHLCLWKYPSLTKVGEIQRHSNRILGLSQSPDGLTVVSAGADQTLRFWDIFGPPCAENSKLSGLESLLSLKTSPIR